MKKLFMSLPEMGYFRIRRLVLERVFIGSLGHLIPKGYVLQFLEEPIHIASVLKQLIFKPETILKSSNSLKRVGAELVSASIAVVSSAY